MAVVVQDGQVLLRGRRGDQCVLERNAMAGLRRQVVQRLPGGADDPLRQRCLPQRVQIGFEVLEVSLVASAVENLEGDNRRDDQLVALKRSIPQSAAIDGWSA
jgi:hypothetical protein